MLLSSAFWYTDTACLKSSWLEFSMERRLLTPSPMFCRTLGGVVGLVVDVALFDMPNSNRFNILAISIFSKISLSISISIFSKYVLVDIDIFQNVLVHIDIF